jgi:6-pyruvoyltetrahydropterin/6-carboxytetrahydropterin synthase
MWKDGIIQLRIIPATGAEQFAKYIYEKLNTFIKKETDGRVKIVQVEFREHEKNTAFYKSDDKQIDQYKSNSKYEF